MFQTFKDMEVGALINLIHMKGTAITLILLISDDIFIKIQMNTLITKNITRHTLLYLIKPQY